VLAAFAALVVPALAETLNGLQTAPGQGMGRIDHGMMSRGTVGGGCAEMMQSMNGGTERPNSQWRSPVDGCLDPRLNGARYLTA
jgi:hypothetical protein